MNESEATTNVFTEDGRILQTEYAIKNVSKAGTMLGLVATDGIVLIGFKQSKSTHGREKIVKISPNIYAAVAGISSDCIQILSYARLQSETFLERLGIEIPVRSLCNSVGLLKQGFTQEVGTRTFAVTFMYAGIDNDGYCLLSTDPSGSVIQWRSVSFGENSTALNNTLKGENTSMDLMDGTRYLLRVLKETREIKDEELDKLEILHFSEKSKRYLTEAEIRECM